MRTQRVVLLTALSIMLCFKAGAQDRNVRLDLLGAANAVGVSYDARFKGDSGWGFAAGIGYGFGIGNWYRINGVGVPVEINYLTRGRKHHFEAGAGMSNGVYFNKITEYKTVDLDGLTCVVPEEVRKTQWGYFDYITLNVPSGAFSNVPLRIWSLSVRQSYYFF